jgi:hypothetical protein
LSAPRSPSDARLKHHSSRESCESAKTVRRERSIPLRETQMSFLEIEVEEEDESEDADADAGGVEAANPTTRRPALQHSQSFLDLSSRMSGDTMREDMAMFS